MLAHAVEEAARLLDADGAMVYLVEGEKMRFAVDAGIRNPEAQQLIRELTLPVGVGLFGHSAATGEIVVTGDYRRDKRFAHSRVADRIVAITNMRSMAAAPLIAEGQVLGALGAFSSRIDDFGDSEVALLRALADHAAAAIANQRLIERLAQSQEELARRVDAQRTLGKITAALAGIHSSDEILPEVVESARRLLGSDGAHLTLMDPSGAFLLPTVVVGGNSAWTEEWLAELEFPVNGGINGLAAATGSVTATADYMIDPRIPHAPDDQAVATRLGLRGMASAPLRGPEGQVIGTLAVSFESVHRFTDDELELLVGLADQAAIAISNARLLEKVSSSEGRLRQQTDELARRVDAQRTLAEMAAQLTSLRDPSAVLEQTLVAAVRLLKGDGGQIGMISADESGTLRWGDGHSFVDGRLTPFTKEDHTAVDEGVSGLAVRERRAMWTEDYVTDASFGHDANADRIARELGIRAVIAAPLLGEDGPIGAMGVFVRRPGAFDADAAELLGLLADQATIVLTNARLYAEAEIAAAQLSERIDAQEAVAAISAEIVTLRDPAAVLQRTAEEALRLLEADTAIINPLEDSDALLGWPIAYAPSTEPTDDFPVRIGEGISGRAMAERRVMRTGDYLTDPDFDHTDELDAYIKRRGIRSVMTAPLVSSAGDLGVLTVQAARPHAFHQGDAELLRVLANQAAIAITNARLYDELGQESVALARQTDSQRRLLQINERLLRTLDPASVLELIADGLKSVVWYDNFSIYRVDDEMKVLQPVLARDRNAQAVLGFPIAHGQGLTWWSVEHREPVLLNDALNDPRVIQIPGTVEEQEAMITVPLISGDEVIGAMNIARTGGVDVAFTDADFELVQLFAGQAAVAITNARLSAEIEESERRYRHLVDNSPDIVWSVDAEGRFTFFSDSFEGRTGWKPEQLLGQPFTAVATEETLGVTMAAWEGLRQDPSREQRLRLDMLLPDGRISRTEVAMTGTVVEGRFSGAHGSVRDISERERLEGDLRSQAAELAASQERAHLARELHDSVTQALFSMGLTLRTLELLLETDPTAAHTKVAELRELQKDALAEMRTLIFELRPSSLESDGLVQALRTHATAVQRRTGLLIVVDAEPIDRLALPAEEALYRIGQEALHNIVKHANASNATIRILREGDRVRLVVTDDGAGFAPDEVPRGHLGLIGMRQRVDLVGGELRVESRPGQGTLIEATVPAGDGVTAK